MKQTYRCWAEVDLQALRENLGWIRHQVGPAVRVMTVVKADAYGHGLKQIAAWLMQSGTDIFGVANLTEARSVRAVGRGWPILMLGAALASEVEEMVSEEVMPTISSLIDAKAFSQVAHRQHKSFPVHIKVDTGMGRLGIEPGKALWLINQVRRLPGLVIQGLYTHYSAAEEDTAFSRLQANRFKRLLQQLDRPGTAIPLVHANNSAALLHQPETLFNLVRPGLLVYGLVPAGRRRSRVKLQHQLRPALSLKCRVTLVKTVRKGTALSYGHTFVAPKRMRIATLGAGYGDGYMRAASHHAQVLISGHPCPILGRITMDQMLADVSRIAEVVAGDEAVLIGHQGGQEISAQNLAEWCGTVPWEILTNINQRVPRLYFGTNAA